MQGYPATGGRKPNQKIAPVLLPLALIIIKYIELLIGLAPSIRFEIQSGVYSE
jgi:hypothetical protein